mgnify:CR=1 FL=1
MPSPKMVVEGIKTNAPLHRKSSATLPSRQGGLDIHYLERRLGLQVGRAFGRPCPSTSSSSSLPSAELQRIEDACVRLQRHRRLACSTRAMSRCSSPVPARRPSGRSVRLRALFTESVDPELAAATIAAVLGLRARPHRRRASYEDRVWEREWLRDFRPMRFGRRLWVVPVGQQPEGHRGRGPRARPWPCFLAPARMPRLHSASNGSTVTSRAASACSTTAAAPASSHSPRSQLGASVAVAFDI